MRRVLILAITTAVSAMAATSASAAVTITSFSASPSTTAAAAHPNVTTSFAFSYSSASDDVRSTTVNLPPGLVGNPNAAAKCTTTQLAADACPAASKIGTVTSVAKQDTVPLLPPVTANGDVYNVAPTGTEPARIGMVIRPLGGLLGKFSLSGPARVRVPGNYGLTVTFDNLPRQLPAANGLLPIPVQIQSISLTLNGLAAGGSKAFMTNPTSCARATTTASATSYASSTPSTRSSSFTPTDCAHVPFSPGLGIAASAPKAGGPESLIVSSTVPGTEFPRSQSHIRSTDVYLPAGTGLNGLALIGLTPCTNAQLAINSAAPANCPAASKVGVAVIVSPLVGTAQGSVFFAQGTATQPLRMFITAKITATQTAKFIATNTIHSNGAIQATLSNLPQTPVTTFALGFPGGASGLLLAPATCGTHYGAGFFTPWKGGGPVGVLDSQTVTRDATGAPCASAAVARTFATPLTRGLRPSSAATSTVPRHVRRLLHRSMRRLRHHMRARS